MEKCRLYFTSPLAIVHSCNTRQFGTNTRERLSTIGGSLHESFPVERQSFLVKRVSGCAKKCRDSPSHSASNGVLCEPWRCTFQFTPKQTFEVNHNVCFLVMFQSSRVPTAPLKPLVAPRKTPTDIETLRNTNNKTRLEGSTAFTNNRADFAGAVLNVGIHRDPESFVETEGRVYKTPTITYPDGTVFQNNTANVSLSTVQMTLDPMQLMLSSCVGWVAS